ncbi:MAG: hypothetical protein AAF298_08545 [Cyanobacteria bacterium P01_A01_bin.40]
MNHRFRWAKNNLTNISSILVFAHPTGDRSKVNIGISFIGYLTEASVRNPINYITLII